LQRIWIASKSVVWGDDQIRFCKYRYFVPKCECRQAVRRKAIRRVNVSVNSSRAGSIAGRMLSDLRPESTEEVQPC
jgi:hypothetical protein